MADMIKKYVDKFGENFPLFLVMGMSDKEVDKQIEKSIKDNKPFRPEIVEGYIY
jgi:hypothetical protein